MLRNEPTDVNRYGLLNWAPTYDFNTLNIGAITKAYAVAVLGSENGWADEGIETGRAEAGVGRRGAT